MAEQIVPRLTLLPDGLAHQYVIPTRCHSTRCSICRRVYRRHGKRSLVMWCGRCGIEFSDRCYFRSVVGLFEGLAFWLATDDELTRRPYLWLCQGCRS